MDYPKIIIAGGEPAGIGPDVICRASLREFPFAMAVTGDPEVLGERAAVLGIEVEVKEIPPQGEAAPHRPGVLNVIPVKAPAPVVPGTLDTRNGEYVVRCMDAAVDHCLSGQYHALVTAPAHKGIINDAGIPFTGHTEHIARRCGADRPVMMLANDAMRVCLATTHAPLAEVPALITQQRLTAVLDTMVDDLPRLFGIANPKIGVCGLNPHAGEGGHLGDEEVRVIAPVIQAFHHRGVNVTGPIPADTAFTRTQLERYDCILAMYHDQGLPVVKHQGFGEVVNITLGLPIIRTSVDHGVALDRASGAAGESSLVAALVQAAQFATRRGP